MGCPLILEAKMASLDDRIIARFDDLIGKGNRVLASGKTAGVVTDIEGLITQLVDPSLCYEWATNSLNLLQRVFGEDSVHYKNFISLKDDLRKANSSHKCQGILIAAKEDYEKGYLFDTKLLLEADIFATFIEQAAYLNKQGYYQAAAVITGGILEEGVRNLYMRNIKSPIEGEKFDKMNADLVKAGLYNSLQSKSLIALYDLRNKAAHAKWSEFTKIDVDRMIRDVSDFLSRFYN